MHRFFTIFWRELRGYYVTPVVYVFATIFALLTGLLTFVVGGYFQRGEANLSGPFFSWIPLLMALFAPAIGMRIWADENRQGTLDLLFSHPIRLSSLIFAKFLAALAALCTALAITLSFVFTTSYLGEPDYNVIATSYLGAIPIGASFVAISCACSAASRNQVIAFVVSATLCLLFVLIGTERLSNEVVNLFPGSSTLVDSITTLAIGTHYEGFRKGFIETRSLIYFLTFIGTGLFINYATVVKKQG